MKKKNSIIPIIILTITCVALNGCKKVDEAELQKREAAKETLKAEKNRQREAKTAERRRQETVYFTIDSLGGTVLEKNYDRPTLIVYATNLREEKQVAFVIYYSTSTDERTGGILEATSKELTPGTTISVRRIFLDNSNYSVEGGKRTIECLSPTNIIIHPPQDGSMTSSLEIPASMDVKNPRP